MKFPYGVSSFAEIRRGGFFYVDKTPFLPRLESAEAGFRYLLFHRPRGMGKSLLASMLEHYYDLGRADEYDDLFRGLWVHEHPTPERNKYLVLPLDFSAVATDRGAEVLLCRFFGVVQDEIYKLAFRYRDRIPEISCILDRIDEQRDSEALLGTLMAIVSATGHKLYIIIDEYDNFANRLLSDGAHGVYESAVLRTGFVRTFYATLKAGTKSGAVGRIFVTGVSPVLLDDLSSGFNIVRHISNLARFNTLAGFTHADATRAVDELLAGSPGIAKDPRLADRAALDDVLTRYYDGYRFAEDAAERVFNSDMVLYFLAELENRGRYPANMLDLNVRTDYQRLQRIGALSGATADARRAVLETIASEGYIDSPLVQQFGSGSLASRDQFVSLLYYLGMLTLAEQPPDSAVPRLEIPNRVIRELQWEHLAQMLADKDGPRRSVSDAGGQVHYGCSMDSTADVLAVIADMTARWNAKDAAAFTEVFADAADFTDVIGQTARGRAAIEAQHRFPFTRNMRQAVLTVDDASVRSLGPDVSVALVRWTSTGNLSLDGAPVPDRKGNMLVVLRRSAGGAWRIVSVLNQDPMGVYGKQVAAAGGLPALTR